jgi:asparaginyl-tRNA synthetase
MESAPPIVAIRDLAAVEGREATLRGWLHGKRSGGKVVFLLVRDGTGVCQCVVEASAAGAYAAAAALGQESSLAVTGRVRRDARAPGGHELAVTALTVLQAAVDYPISRKAHGIDFLLSHRHLWLRSARPAAILRIRHTVIKTCRDFFDARGFTLIDTPILVAGAGEDRQSLFPVDYFGEPAFLTQTGQLHLESACMALGKVYCFGPTFRAEKSKTRRHLTEFWMVEPEVAFAGLDEVMDLAGGLVCALAEAVRLRHAADLRRLGRDLAPLEKVTPPFPRITYSEAVEILRSPETRARLEAEFEADRRRLQTLIAELDACERDLAAARKGWQQEQLEGRARELRETIRDLDQDLAARPDHIRSAAEFAWGGDLGGSDETVLARHFDKPVFVTRYPRAVKAFYMKVAPEDDRVVLNCDLLAPEGYGEIVGGSQREENPEVLAASLKAKGLNADDYAWYLDLRRYGSVPHGGFGLGIERVLTWLCGLTHVRETIPFPRTLGRLRP